MIKKAPDFSGAFSYQTVKAEHPEFGRWVISLFLLSVTMSLEMDTDLWYNANIPCFHKDKDMEDDL